MKEDARKLIEEEERDLAQGEAEMQAETEVHSETKSSTVVSTLESQFQLPSDVEIIESVHTKKGYPIFTVVFKEHLDRAIFDQRRDISREYGGYWSAYQNRRAGVQKGFIFKTRLDAEAFLTDVMDLNSFVSVDIETKDSIDSENHSPIQTMLRSQKLCQRVGVMDTLLSVYVDPIQVAEHFPEAQHCHIGVSDHSSVKVVRRDFLDYVGRQKAVILEALQSDPTPLVCHGLDCAEALLVSILPASYKASLQSLCALMGLSCHFSYEDDTTIIAEIDK
jgi:hypothetical protein